MILLSKLLQALGVIISIAGLVGDDKLLNWEFIIRSRLSKIDIKKLIIDFLDKTEEFIENNPAILRITLLVLICLITFSVFGLARSSKLLRIPAIDSMIVVFRYLSLYTLFSVCGGVVVYGYGLFLFGLLRTSFEFFKLHSQIERLNKFIESIENMWHEHREKILLLIYLPVNVYFYIFGVIILTPLILIIMMYSILIILLKISLIPYQILDLIAEKYKLKSTVLLIGISVELLGIILS